MFAAVAQGIRKRQVLKDLKSLELPSFPAVAANAIDVIRNPKATSAELASVLEEDPGLSVRVMRTANSAVFATRHRIANLSQAISMLGLSHVESLVLSAAVRDAIPKPACAAYDATRFWVSSARRAAASQALSKRLHPSDTAAAFTAALLQDLAVPLLAFAKPDDYAEVLRLYGEDERSLPELEKEILGNDHAEVGGWLCKSWKLPEVLTAAVAGHHEPPGSVAGFPLSVSLVSSLRDVGDTFGMEAFTQQVQASAGWSPEEIEKLAQMSLERAEELGAIFS